MGTIAPPLCPAAPHHAPAKNPNRCSVHFIVLRKRPRRVKKIHRNARNERRLSNALALSAATSELLPPARVTDTKTIAQRLALAASTDAPRPPSRRAARPHRRTVHTVKLEGRRVDCTRHTKRPNTPSLALPPFVSLSRPPA